MQATQPCPTFEFLAPPELYFPQLLNFFDCTTQHVGSYFPNQGSNLHPTLHKLWTTREVP